MTVFGQPKAVTIMLGPETNTSLQNQARAMSALSHRNVRTMHCAGHYNGKHIVVMEHCDFTLQQAMELGLFTPDNAKESCFQLMHAVKAMHAEGISHGQLDKEHVLCCKTGAGCLVLKVSGLGKAKMQADAAALAKDVDKLRHLFKYIFTLGSDRQDDLRSLPGRGMLERNVVTPQKQVSCSTLFRPLAYFPADCTWLLCRAAQAAPVASVG